MKEFKDDIWKYHREGYYVVIPTNGNIKTNGQNVMGRGLALQARELFLKLPDQLGRAIKYGGNKVFLFDNYRVFSFPVKHSWNEKADLSLILESTQDLLDLVNIMQEDQGKLIKVALPKVGCGAGNLTWKEVKPIITEYLDDRFIIVDIK